MTHETVLDIPGYRMPTHEACAVPHEVASRRSSVLVHEHPAAFAALATVLRQLNCIPIAGTSTAQGSRMASGLRAAVVSDAMADAIDVCASLPHDLPKILIASRPTFALRCAAARAGVEAIIERPVDVNELSAWLEHFHGRETPAPISVLLIDDHALTADLHAAVLRRAGMMVRIVTDPLDVLPALQSATPDLVLMDIQMPGVDGIELARVIRQSREYLSIPIAFLSAESDESRKMAARKCGGDDFISKPVDLTRLAGHVRLRAERARAMRSLIERDSLTGLLNHGAFRERVAAESERSRRTGAALSLAMIDLDRFKAINDTYGHPVGDQVLRTLGLVLAGRLRATDLVGRYGGEEFGVLLLDTGLEMARDVIDAVRRQFEEIVFDEPGGRFSVTFSAGIADRRGVSTLQLFSAADEALYQAKRNGRNTVELAVAPPTPGNAVPHRNAASGPSR